MELDSVNRISIPQKARSRGFGKTLKCFQRFTRRSVQYDLNPRTGSPCVLRISLIISRIGKSLIKRKHKLIELRKIIEEVEIATNVKLNPLYIVDRKDEIGFESVTLIDSILNRDNEHKKIQLGTVKMRLQLDDCIEFDNILQNRVQELNLKLKESDNLRESDILINEIGTLDSILGQLMDLKYGEKTRAVEISEASQDFWRANRVRKQIIKIQDLEDEISVRYVL